MLLFQSSLILSEKANRGAMGRVDSGMEDPLSAFVLPDEIKAMINIIVKFKHRDQAHHIQKSKRRPK